MRIMTNDEPNGGWSWTVENVDSFGSVCTSFWFLILWQGYFVDFVGRRDQLWSYRWYISCYSELLFHQYHQCPSLFSCVWMLSTPLPSLPILVTVLVVVRISLLWYQRFVVSVAVSTNLDPNEWINPPPTHSFSSFSDNRMNGFGYRKSGLGIRCCRNGVWYVCCCDCDCVCVCDCD